MPQRVLVTGERARGVALVVAGVITAQFGAGFAVTLFDELGPAGAAFLRLFFAALVLVAVWRPRLRGHTVADLRLAVTFGVVLGDDELGDLLGDGPDPARRRGDDRVRRAARRSP